MRNQTVLPGLAYRMYAIANAQLSVDVRKMEVDRSFCNVQIIGSFLARLTFSNQGQDFNFSTGQSDLFKLSCPFVELFRFWPFASQLLS